MARPLGELKHGTTNGYRRGCRCQLCRDSINQANRKTRAKHPATRRNYRYANREFINESTRNYKRRNPKCSRENLWRSSGIDMSAWSWDSYLAMLSHQHSQCKVCGRKLVASTDLATVDSEVARVDHNHETGQVRGLLCHCCNTAAGLLSDNAIRADRLALYLRGNI